MEERVTPTFNFTTHLYRGRTEREFEAEAY